MQSYPEEMKIGRINKPEVIDSEPAEPLDTSLADFTELLDQLARTARKPKAPAVHNHQATLPKRLRSASVPTFKTQGVVKSKRKTQPRLLALNTERKIAESDYDHSEVSTIDLSRERREGEELRYESKSGYIMATALTAAALSSYLVVKSFRAFFL